MAVKLEPLVILSKGARADQGLIPFSDYSRWERRRGDKGPHKKSKQGVSQVPPSDLKSAAITPVPRGAEDARSVHGQRYRLMLKSAPVRIRLSTKHYEPARIRMLKSELEIKRPSVGVYKAYINDLYADNMAIIHSITQSEEETHTSTDRMLDRYQHFKGTMATLKRKSGEILSQAKDELETTKTKLSREIEVYRARVAAIDEVLEKNSRHLQTLRHYKDKDYPVRVIRIEELREQLVEVRANQAEEMEELKQQIIEEMEEYEKQMMAIKLELEAKATKTYLDTTERSIETKAIQNRIMSKEVEIHSKNRTYLQETILELKSAIKEMKMPGENYRQKRATFCGTYDLLPHRQYLKTVPGRCLPDTEITLNIPTQQQNEVAV